MPDFSVGLIEYDSEQYLESVALRLEILRKPLGLEFDPEVLKNDKNEYHIAATDGQSIIGILLLRPISESVVKMRQVAVKDSRQSQGIGKAMVNYSEELAHNLGFTNMELHAREVALDFYKSLGYHTVGDMFHEIGIPHFKMLKQL